MEKEKKFARTLVTTALPYANGPVHIGHLAGVYVPADIYVRYLRLQGENVLFVGGSDEHGVPVTQRARKEGITPQQVVDRYHAIIRDSFEELGISYDIYSRTTSKTHHQFAAEFFRKLYDEGKLIEKVTKQFYDEQDGKFLTDRDVEGECPYCHHPAAKGNQCEDGCGRDLDPTELINPHAKDSDHPLVLKDTTNWFLPLNEYEGWLKEWILEGHKEWRSNVYGQCKSWLDNGLQPRAMTRDLDWGIPVPVEGAEGKVLYVWFDAPIGLGHMAAVVAAAGHAPHPLHRQGQHRVPLHHLPHDDEGPWRLCDARQRAGQRVPEPGRRQDFHQPQLGCVAA